MSTCKLILRQLLVLHNLVVLTSITFVAVICDADDPCSGTYDIRARICTSKI